jgi:hypothetical protein
MLFHESQWASISISARKLFSISGRRIFTKTSVPSRSRARCPCAIDAAAYGFRIKFLKKTLDFTTEFFLMIPRTIS